MEERDYIELHELREQIGLLKEKLQRQQIISEQNIIATAQKGIGKLNKAGNIWGILGIFAVVYCSWSFHRFGFSDRFVIGTAIFLAICVAVTIYAHWGGKVAAEILNKIATVEAALKNKLDSVKGKSLVDDKEIERLAKVDNYDDSELKKSLKNKVDSVEGKSLVSDVEIERLAKVDNYDDSELKQLIESKANDEEFKKLIKRVFDIEKKEKFKIENVPTGTLVNYQEKEIRIMCPENVEWKQQNVGEAGNANMYYMSFKAYAPEGAVSFKEGDRGVINDEMFTFEDKFAGKDEHGNYSICWLALASLSNGTWTYFGKNSVAKKYIGWDYVVEWYNAEGNIIATDSIRINLSNESCHLINEPYYISKIMAEIEEIKNKLQ